MNTKTNNVKITDEALSSLMAMLEAGPIIITGADMSVRSGDRTLTLHYTDAATEQDRETKISLSKEPS